MITGQRKKTLFILIGLGFVIFNPIHLSWSLPYLVSLDYDILNFIKGREESVILFSTIYFTLVMIPIYYRLFTRNRRKKEKDLSFPEERETYRGPGGGKRPRSRNAKKRR